MLAAIHPDRLRMALDPSLSREAVAALRASERLRDRVEIAVARRYRVPSDAEPFAEDAAPRIGDDDLRETAIARAGLAFLAGGLVKDIGGGKLAAAARTFGEDTLRFALAHASTPSGGDTATDERAVRRAGRACMAAWRDASPALHRARTLLCPPGAFCGVEVTGRHRDIGAALFERALQSLPTWDVEEAA